MNIEKYNQRLLAIIGTLVLAGVGLGLLASLVAFFIFLVSELRDDTDRNSLSVHQRAPDSRDEGKEQFILSFGQPQLIDSTKALFVITCGQVKDFESIQLTDEIASYTKISSKRGFYGYRGTYNNIIVFDRLKNRKSPVFNKKVSIAEFHTYNVKGQLYLFIIAAEADSDKDGMLNGDDLHSLYIWNIESNKMDVHNFDKSGVKSLSRLDFSDEFVVELVSDVSNNGKIDASREKVYYKHINSKFEVSDLVPGEMMTKLEQLIN